MAASNDVNSYRGDALPSGIGLTSSVPPEANTPNSGECLQIGVSTRSVHKRTCSLSQLEKKNTNNFEHWYALRTTYGREKKAYDYIIQHKGIAFLPIVCVDKIIRGQKKRIEISRIPNTFFVYGTEESVKQFVYDNVNLPYLRFYYRYTHLGRVIKKEPMIIPDNQLQSFKIICEAQDKSNVFVLKEEIVKFRKGEKVRVKDGNFEGVVGIVARYHGQQRVGLVIDGLLTAITAYIPTAFLERI